MNALRRRNALVSVLVLLVLFLVSCSPADSVDPGETSDPDTPGDNGPGLANDTADVGDTVVSRITPTPTPPTLHDTIHKAFLDGKIDRQTEVLLLLQASYFPESVPDEYVVPGQSVGTRTLMGEMQWLMNHHHELDPKTRELVTPFILSAEDPGSYFHPGYEADRSARGGLFRPAVAYASPIAWSQKSISIAGAPGSITLNYREQGLPAAKQAAIAAQVRDIEEALAKAWPRFKTLLGVELQHDLKIFLTPQLPAMTHGDAVYFQTQDSPNWPLDPVIAHYQIRLNESETGDSLKSTTVHELFHCFQFQMGLTWYYLSTDLLWLVEATAVWAEHDVYPSFNKEHQYLEDFFYYLDADRLSTEGTREYASYVLFFFLTESLGQRRYVPDILSAASESKDTMDLRGMLMNEIANIRSIYGRFAVCNWNGPPRKCYVDNPPFPDYIPAGDSRHDFNVEQRGEVGPWTMWIGPGGTAYQVFHFDAGPEVIEKVKFDFRAESFEPAGSCVPNDMQWVARHALIKVGGVWKPEPEDWTELEERVFCRKNDLENIDCVVLVLSNANMYQEAMHTCKVDTREDCSDMRGSVLQTAELTVQEGSDSTVWREEMVSNDDLTHCPECGWYVLKSRDLAYSGLYSLTFINPYLAAVGQRVVETFEQVSSGGIQEEYDASRAFARLRLSADGQTVSLNVDVDTRSKDWVTITRTGTGVLAEAMAKPAVEQTGYSPLLIWPYKATDFEVGEKTHSFAEGTVTDTCKVEESMIAGKPGHVITGSRVVRTRDGAEYRLEFKFEVAAPED